MALTSDGYLERRLLDAYLREDLFGMVSRGTMEGDCLRFSWSPDRTWRIPLAPGDAVQRYRVAEAFVWENERRLESLEELSRPLFERVDEPQALREELLTAVRQRTLCQAEQARWFRTLEEPRTWHEWMLHYDRLASFQDHPYYPTARAKVGLTDEDLRRYAPEFGNRFELRWTVGQNPTPFQGPLPAWWPRSRQGVLVPVHPHTLESMPDLDAPLADMWARPTLSVRTVALEAEPAYHLKLPLLMRSLSYKNLRKVKPDTLIDGHLIQSYLQEHVGPELGVLFTDESVGMAVDNRADLGCILRRYPAEELRGCRVLPVAALHAPVPGGGTVLDTLGPDFPARYAALTLRLHLTLWCRYGIALESNQQNTLIVISPDGSLRLLLKDNDAARLYRPLVPDELASRLQDPCLLVEDWESIANMFITITLQLNLFPFVPELRPILEDCLTDLPRQDLVRRYVLEPERLPVKYLFSAGTLFSKARTGAADINKHYGRTGPNPLQCAR